MLLMSLWRCFWEPLFGTHAKHSSAELRGLGQRMQPLTRAGWEDNLLMVSLSTSCFFFILLSFLGYFRSWLQMANDTIYHLAPHAAARLWNILNVLVIAPRNCVYIIWETFRVKEKKWPKQLSAFGLLFEYLKTLHLESIPLICG